MLLARRILVVILCTFAGAGVAMFGVMIALLIYVSVAYSHPGSMAGFWAFYYGTVAAPFGAIIGLLIGALYLAPRMRAKAMRA